MLYVPGASTVKEIAPPMLKSASQPAICIGFNAGAKAISTIDCWTCA
jgi:hypothetical protein